MSAIPENILNDFLLYLLNKVEEGSLTNYPTFNIYSEGGVDKGTLLASFILPTPAFSRPSALQANLLIPRDRGLSTIAINGGTAKEYAILNKNQQIIFYGGLGGPGTRNSKVGSLRVDVEVNIPIIRKEDPLALTSFSLKFPT